MILLRLQGNGDDFDWRQLVAVTSSLVLRFLTRFLPWAALLAVALIYVLPALSGGGTRGNTGYLQDILLLVSFLFVVTSIVGSKLIAILMQKESDRALTIVSQEDITDSVLDSIQPGSTVNVLLYSGYSMLNRIEDYCKRNPHVLAARFRFLVRDIDLAGDFPQPGMRQRRLNEIGVAIEKFRQFLLPRGHSEMRFYANDPWLRGISVDDQSLWLSHYTNRRDAARDAGLQENEDAYSGLSTPWMAVARNREQLIAATAARHGESIKRFDSLFDMIWRSCTKNKWLLLDLDGTLFASDVLTRFFTETLPERYLQSLAGRGVLTQDAATLYLQYRAACVPGTSTTIALIQTAEGAFTGAGNLLTAYLAWKDGQLAEIEAMLPGPNRELRATLEVVASTTHLAILTNHTSAFTRAALHSMEIEDLFPEDLRFTLDRTRIAKPNPALIQYLVCDAKLDLRRCIFVGDRPEIDLQYMKGCSLARVYVSGPRALQQYLQLAPFPVAWHKTHTPAQGVGYEWR